MNFESVIHVALLGSFLAPLLVSLALATRAISNKPINERIVSFITQTAFLIYLVCALVASLGWLAFERHPIKWDLGKQISLYLDLPGAIFLLATALISNVIIFYSRRYLHRDPGYRRFFMILSLFIFGMTTVTTAGSFDFIFAGWEIVGLSSFLLIGYYWHRPRAAYNANRVYMLYRICDLGFLASALISHLMWHLDDLFYEFGIGVLSTQWSHTPLWQQWLLSLAILLPVIGKSAQFPLCYWLPKAMEGPTPSSAIFYGSLSIHAGVFLLVRTFSIWYNTPGFVWLLGGLGLLTAIFATVCGQVQANIKGQIGYASIAQVGLMLIELALGLPTFAMCHLVGNAFLRCFQLLVSPSILTQQLQIHSALEGRRVNGSFSFLAFLPKRLEATIYVFATNEGYLEALLHRIFARPFIKLAEHANSIHSLFITPKRVLESVQAKGTSFRSIIILPPSFLSLFMLDHYFGDIIWVPFVLLAITLFFSLSAFGETKRASSLINAAAFSQLMAVFSLWMANEESHASAIFYFFGISTSWVLASNAMDFILKKREISSLRSFLGLFAQFPFASSIVFIGILGIIGFPISSTFFAEETILQHAHQNGILFLLAFVLVYILNGICLVRMYTFVFWGKRNNDTTEFKMDFSVSQTLIRLAFFILGNVLTFWV